MKNDALSICQGQEISYAEALELEVAMLRSRLADAEERNREEKARFESAAANWIEEKTTLLATISVLFAPRSERQRYLNTDAKQMYFDLPGMDFTPPAEDESPEEQPVPATPVPAPRKKAKKRVKQSTSGLAYSLPVEETIVEKVAPPNCDICGEQMKVIGYTTWREICIQPARLYAREYQSPVFACENCDKNGTLVPIVRPEMPLARPLPRSLVSAETLAWLIYQKLAMFTPLYRLEAFFFQFDVEISRMTMCNWMIGACEAWLAPLAARMGAELLGQPVIHADETPFQVLIEEGRKPQSKGYSWIFCSTYYGIEVRYCVFIYSPSRAHTVPLEFLQGFAGYVMCDAYQAYDKMTKETTGIFLCRCWAHCRREWYKAATAMKWKPDSPAVVGYDYVQKLFVLENEFDELSLEQRFQMRMEQEKPLLDEFRAWLDKQYKGKTALGRAVNYTLDHWEDLYQVLADARLPVTNAAAELMAKSVALGRKNFLFSKTVAGADAVMTGLSVLETGKANDLKPYEYLLWIFGSMPKDWRDILNLGLGKALRQADDMAERAFEELAPLIGASIKIPDGPGHPRDQWEAFARGIVCEKIIDPLREEVKGMLVSEAKFALSGYYLPPHAPPSCRKSGSQTDENSKSDKETA